jgi:hypothetical protein
MTTTTEKPAPDAEGLIKTARELAKHYDGCDEDAAKAKFLRDLADALTAATQRARRQSGIGPTYSAPSRPPRR